MKKLFAILISMLASAVMFQVVLADTPGDSFGIGINIDISGADPYIWMDPNTRIFRRNPAGGSGEAIERINNYAFEGEQVEWSVLVLDQNGAETINDVRVTIGSTQGTGNNIESTCDINSSYSDGQDISQFNARIGTQNISTFDLDTMEGYTCTLTVETPASMDGEFWVVGEVEDDDGNMAAFDENEFWFFNPIIALAVDGSIDFGTALPGSMSYSDTLSITNNADGGSGVLLDMQISGTDFYDPASSGAKCPTTNRLKLNNGGNQPIYDNDGAVNPAIAYIRGNQSMCDSDALGDVASDTNDDLGIEGINGVDGIDTLCYYAANGAYSTNNDAVRNDIEGYVGISYATSDDDNRDPIISSTAAAHRINLGGKEFFAGNVLSPGADLSITFRLLLPEPCSGDFSDGQIYFWGEAI